MTDTKEIPTIKPGQVYLYEYGTSLHEVQIIEVKGDFIKLDDGILRWVTKTQFKTRSRQLLYTYKHFLGIRLWKIK